VPAPLPSPTLHFCSPLPPPITVSLPTLSLIKRIASNDNNGKHKLEEETETLAARKRLRLSNNDGGDGDSSNS
jgi:hypothetical protein